MRMPSPDFDVSRPSQRYRNIPQRLTTIQPYLRPLLIMSKFLNFRSNSSSSLFSEFSQNSERVSFCHILHLHFEFVVLA